MFQILRPYAPFDLIISLRSVHCNWFYSSVNAYSLDFLLQLSNGSILSLVYDSLCATILTDLLYLRSHYR